MRTLNSSGNDRRMSINGRYLSQLRPNAEAWDKWRLSDLHKIKWNEILKAKEKYVKHSSVPWLRLPCIFNKVGCRSCEQKSPGGWLNTGSDSSLKILLEKSPGEISPQSPLASPATIGRHLLVTEVDKESACQCRRYGFSPWVGKIPWRSKWQPTPVFLPGKSYGQRSLEGYSPWGRKRVRHDSATNNNNKKEDWTEGSFRSEATTATSVEVWKTEKSRVEETLTLPQVNNPNEAIFRHVVASLPSFFPWIFVTILCKHILYIAFSSNGLLRVSLLSNLLLLIVL